MPRRAVPCVSCVWQAGDGVKKKAKKARTSKASGASNNKSKKRGAKPEEAPIVGERGIAVHQQCTYVLYCYKLSCVFWCLVSGVVLCCVLVLSCCFVSNCFVFVAFALLFGAAPLCSVAHINVSVYPCIPENLWFSQRICLS